MTSTDEDLEYLPDPEKPISFDSFVEQYTPVARRIMAANGWKPDELRAQMMAEAVAETDLQTIRDLMCVWPDKSAKEVLIESLKPRPVDP